MTMTVKRRGRRKPLQILKRGRFVRRRNVQRRSVNTLKHENASLARQLLQRILAATRRASLYVEKDEDGVGGTVNPGQVTNNRLREQQHQVGGSCSSRRIHRSQDLYTYNGKRMAAVDQEVGQAHLICKRSPFGNLAGQQEEVDVVF